MKPFSYLLFLCTIFSLINLSDHLGMSINSFFVQILFNRILNIISPFLHRMNQTVALFSLIGAGINSASSCTIKGKLVELANDILQRQFFKNTSEEHKQL